MGKKKSWTLSCKNQSCFTASGVMILETANCIVNAIDSSKHICMLVDLEQILLYTVYFNLSKEVLFSFLLVLQAALLI